MASDARTLLVLTQLFDDGVVATPCSFSAGMRIPELPKLLVAEELVHARYLLLRHDVLSA